MKKIVLASAMVVATLAVGTASAFAGNVGPAPANPGVAVVPSTSGPAFAFVADVSYAFEAETFAVEAGVEVEVVDNLTVTPTANFSFNSGSDFTFDGLDVRADYAVNDNWGVYGDLSFNDDFKYEEMVVGVSLRF